MKTYTLGEIFRLGLMKDKNGYAYKTRGGISRMLRKHMKFKRIKTKYGKGLCVTEAEIKKFNKRNI